MISPGPGQYDDIISAESLAEGASLRFDARADMPCASLFARIFGGILLSSPGSGVLAVVSYHCASNHVRLEAMRVG